MQHLDRKENLSAMNLVNDASSLEHGRTSNCASEEEHAQ